MLAGANRGVKRRSDSRRLTVLGAAHYSNLHESGYCIFLFSFFFRVQRSLQSQRRCLHNVLSARYSRDFSYRVCTFLLLPFFVSLSVVLSLPLLSPLLTPNLSDYAITWNMIRVTTALLASEALLASWTGDNLSSPRYARGATRENGNNTRIFARVQQRISDIVKLCTLGAARQDIARLRARATKCKKSHLRNGTTCNKRRTGGKFDLFSDTPPAGPSERLPRLRRETYPLVEETRSSASVTPP